MKAHPSKRRKLKTSQRVGLALIGFGILAFGALTLLAGSLHYTNFWGGLVFAPFALVIGALFINFAVRY